MTRPASVRIPKRYMGQSGENHQAKLKNTVLNRMPGRIILLTATLSRTRINTPKNPFKISPQRDAGNSNTQIIETQIRPSNMRGNGRAMGRIVGAWERGSVGAWERGSVGACFLICTRSHAPTRRYFNRVIFLFS